MIIEEILDYSENGYDFNEADKKKEDPIFNG